MQEKAEERDNVIELYPNRGSVTGSEIPIGHGEGITDTEWVVDASVINALGATHYISWAVAGSPSLSNWDEVEQLKGRISVLEEKVEELEAAVGVQEVTVLRTIDRDTAKKEIRELFQEAESLYFSDVAKQLRLDLPLVVEICQELIEEGEIEVNDDTA